MIARGISLIVGFWLILSPQFLNIQGSLATMNITLGCSIVVFALLAFAQPLRNFRYVNFAIAIWLLATSWTYSTENLMFNGIMCGLILASSSSYGGKGIGMLGSSQKEM